MAIKVSLIDSKYNDGSTCTTSYYIEYKKTVDSNYMVLGTQYASPLVIDNLDDDTSYDFRITRTCCNGVIATPTITTITTTKTDTPTSFEGTAGDTQVSLTWDAVSGANKYIVEMGEQSDYSDAVVIYEGATNSYVKTGLSNGTLYYFRVRAVDDGYLASDWAIDSATPTL